ncbi:MULTISPECIES: sensor histidine kinase [Chryseobacterium]|uniref:GHKL domain-containing protein n=1 Tax=Chryseobacterium cucumeris TaxID=1813611 RepID=A0ABX9XBM6_9FLAO|nr:MULTISPECIES: histidine kinase [Chryseobacterium]MDH5032807.1 histidine kinase [Chryseobacterium cucumeris]QWT86456.1 histidine kinase [Chryseobacterium sp. PCH239]ROH96459.1 GHKL domain-containing protein [Chryseobacterium cucumeris]
MKYSPWKFEETFVMDFLVEAKYGLRRHLLFLIFFFILIYSARFWHWYSGIYQYYVLFFVYTILIAMVYINIYVLVPRFFFKTKYITYLVLLVLMGVVGLNFIGYSFRHLFQDFRTQYIPKDNERGGIYEGVLMCIPIILTTTTIKLLQKWISDNKRINELSNLTLKMELNELRNQINPHFLFNMLNNVKALIRTDPAKASVVLVKLSEFLRYQLYENSEEKTLLTSEIDFLSNFLNLEKIRRDNFSFDIQVNVEKRIMSSIFIPPNLFTTFVENAVKHSVDLSGGESYVEIDINIENKQLYFRCINSRSTGYTVSDKKNSGLGLANITRRLELLYSDTFDLKIESIDKEYVVNLKIPV